MEWAIIIHKQGISITKFNWMALTQQNVLFCILESAYHLVPVSKDLMYYING